MRKQGLRLLTANLTMVILAMVNIVGVACLTPTADKDPVYALKETPAQNVIRVNGLFMVQLKENTSTGYAWHYTITNPEVIQLIETVALKETGAHFFVGRSNDRVWKFKGIKAGQSRIEFKYYRSWEGEAAAAESRSYEVIIADPTAIGS